jgi:DNA-damage-inducible protein J
MENPSTTLTVRTDKKLKNRVGKILKELGLNHSTAINMFYRLVYINKGIPFDVRIPTKETLKALEDSRNRKGLTAYKNSDELFKDLEI